MFLSEDKEKEAKQVMYAKENETERRRFFLRHTRSSKFGTQLQINRADGSRYMLNNIYQKTIDSNNLGKK